MAAARRLAAERLFRNVKGKFVDVGGRWGADLAVRGMGRVAADLDRDGDSDLYVAAAGRSALLWNEGNGRFREGAAAAGVDARGWRTPPRSATSTGTAGRISSSAATRT